MGLVLSILSVILAFYINLIAAGLMLFGLFDNVVIYSRILKRRHPANIILGGFSGGVPALIGYVAVKGTIDLAALIIGAFVVLWIPIHIWSLAIHSKSDYSRARIPMLPVVTTEKTAIRSVASTSILMVLFNILPYMLWWGTYPGFRLFYLAASSALGIAMLAMSTWLFAKPTREKAWIVFKFSGPYLALLFMVMMLDALLWPA